MNVHPDFSDFIKALKQHEVQFVIVGAFALAFHGQPRSTGDLDVWIKPIPANAKALLDALSTFGFQSLSIAEQDILSGKIIQLGFPPVRIDLISALDGLTSDEIWAGRASGKLGDHEIWYLGKEAFIKNKKAVGRHKDLADIESLSGF